MSRLATAVCIAAISVLLLAGCSVNGAESSTYDDCQAGLTNLSTAAGYEGKTSAKFALMLTTQTSDGPSGFHSVASAANSEADAEEQLAKAYRTLASTTTNEFTDAAIQAADDLESSVAAIRDFALVADTYGAGDGGITIDDVLAKATDATSKPTIASKSMAAVTALIKRDGNLVCG